MLMVAIYSLGGISGANFNPAVSVTLGIVRSLGGPGLEWPIVGIYCLVQIVAGIAAACCYSALFKSTFNLSPTKGFDFLSAGSCEALYTCMLCFVVLNVAVAKKNAVEKNQWYGLSIGFVIIAGAYGAGAVSGGCFNPAVAIGIDTASAGLGFGWCLAYMGAELVGAIMAAILFYLVRTEDFKPEEHVDHAAEHSLPKKLVSEFVGTFYLVLTVGLNVLGKSPAGAFSIAAALMSMIYALGDISGANFNPAVTTSLLVIGKAGGGLGAFEAAHYILVQLAGGIAAAFVYTLIQNGHSFALIPQNDSSWSQVATAEVIFTFVLVFAVLCTAVAEQTKSTEMFGLAIGSCVTVGGFAIGGISGGSLNPAVSVGIATTHSAFHGGTVFPAIMYSLFEVSGGLLAVGAYKLTHTTEAAKDDPDDF